MHIRAIFFDIDGTLLGAGRRMPDSALHALKLAREKGILLFVATGRVTEMTAFLRDLFDFDGYLTLTGQYCFDRNGRVLHALPHDKDDIRLLMKLQAAAPFPCLIAEDTRCFMASECEQARRHFISHGLKPPEIYDIRRIEAHDVYQLVTYDPEITDARLAPLKHIRITNAASYCHDVIPAAGGKHVGIRRTAEHYAIGPEEILVFGDGRNDADMLRSAGFGVAMGNACPEAKAAADYITDPVDENGVYNALKNLQVI
ncbi:MAG: Cof-type HAD-IIB family hydrolase [Hominenteromicrobium sp.]